MFKKYLLFFLFLILSNISQAQIFKQFLHKDEPVKDSLNATSYLIFYQIKEDSLWVMREYTMQDSIQVIGTFKDKSLQIPHGKFSYYRLDSAYKSVSYNYVKHQFDTLKVPGRNQVTTTGFYINGIKTGKWVNYEVDGKKATVYTYENNKLNGIYQSFNYDTGKPIIVGNYKNDLREGRWFHLNYYGDTTYQDIFEKNKIIKSISYAQNKKYPILFIGGYPEYNFIRYVKDIFNNIDLKDINARTYITFILNPEGKLVKPLVGKGFGIDINSQVIDAIMASPPWKPASKENKPHEISITIFIKVYDHVVQSVEVMHGKKGT